jgi:MFS family permease
VHAADQGSLTGGVAMATADIAAGPFPAFRHRNFRYYAIGQLASIGGTWMQNVALAWLVLDLTDSGTAVGLIGAALFAPSLVLGAWSGSVADRFDPRRTVIVLNAVLGAQAVTVALVVFSGVESFGLLLALALWNGVAATFDRPIRQTLMNELVGDAELPNAIATNSALVQLGLVVGPAVGAVLIDTIGIAWCFAVNAATYAVMILAIVAIRPSEMIDRPKASGEAASVKAGLTYLRRKRDVQTMLIALAWASALAYRVDVLQPLLAKDLGHGSGLFAALTVIRGCGALAGALFLASRFGSPSMRIFVRALVLMALAMIAMAIPVTWVALVASFPVGIGMMLSLVCTLSLTQLWSDSAYRGRVVAIWFVVLGAGVVAGSVLAGALADLIGVPQTVALAGASLLVLVAVVLRRNRAPRHGVDDTSALPDLQLER